MLPPDFDFKVLDEPSFKEDAVREEIVAPILRHLGYRPTGDIRVERSKALVHPFVMIGTKKHPIKIIPDYTLFKGSRPLFILDAKAPSEDIVKSIHVEQAYSYAIHPEIRCENFGLCNGRKLVVFSTATLHPILQIECQEINANWDAVERALHPRFLEKPVLREFLPDLGIHFWRAGSDMTDTLIRGVPISLITKMSEELYSAQCPCEIGGLDFMATFDMQPAWADQIFMCLPSEKRSAVGTALTQNPFAVAVDEKIRFDAEVTLGPLTSGEHEEFIPLIVRSVISTTYLSEHVSRCPPSPNYLFRL